MQLQCLMYDTINHIWSITRKFVLTVLNVIRCIAQLCNWIVWRHQLSVNNLYIVTVFCAWEIVRATWQMFIWLGLWSLIFEVSPVTSTQRVEPVSVSWHTSVCPSQRIWYVDRDRWVIQDDMPHEFVPIQSQSPQVEKMADFKVCLLHQYACNQKTNGELWYS